MQPAHGCVRSKGLALLKLSLCHNLWLLVAGARAGAGSRRRTCGPQHGLPAGAGGGICAPGGVGRAAGREPVDHLLCGHHHVPQPAAPGLWPAAGAPPPHSVDADSMQPCSAACRTRSLACRHTPSRCRFHALGVATVVAASSHPCTQRVASEMRTSLVAGRCRFYYVCKAALRARKGAQTLH